MGVDAHQGSWPVTSRFVEMGRKPHWRRGVGAHDRPMASLRTRRDPAGLEPRKRPTLRARRRAAWNADKLDEALADGADPLASDELALTAARLVEPGRRVELADSLERLVERVVAGGPSPVPGPTILRREPIARNLGGVLALADRLRAEGLHCLRGLAMADRLVRYGDSPLYLAMGPLQLRHRIHETLAALEPGWDGQPADMPRGDGR
jgi:hypothetical protein